MPDDLPPLVSAEDWAQTPPEVQQAFLTLVDMVRQLSARVHSLEARLKQTSRNTSKPPSSDPPSAPPPPPRVERGKPKGARLVMPMRNERCCHLSRLMNWSSVIRANAPTVTPP